MNVASLQMQGLLCALAAINQMLVDKGAATTDDIAKALSGAEQALSGDDRFTEDMEPQQRDAVLFPLRYLHMANSMAANDEGATFSDLARMVGKLKEKYNDQL